jgi:hypothetical protein
VNYGDIIRDAFRITWRNRFLWFFGFFAAGSGGVSNLFNVPSNFQRAPGDLAGVPRWVSENLVAALVVVGILALVLVLLFIVLSLISSGGLAESVAAMDGGEGRRFSSTWRAGIANFWRVLAQAVLLFLIGLGLLLLIALVAVLPIVLTFALTDSVGARVSVSGLFGLLGVLLLILVYVPLTIIGQYALRELVVDRERIAYSIAAGYGLFRRNIGRSLLVWIISIALSIGIGIALVVFLLLVGLVLFLPSIALGFAEYATAAVVAGVVAGVILLPIFLVISGALGAFSHAYWTLAYLRLTNRPRGGPEPAQSAVA